MAKWVLDTPPPFVGTINDICIYKAPGGYHIRHINRLSRERVLTGSEFAGTRRHAGAMAIASKMGSAIYKALPAGSKDRSQYRAITGEAASLLYKGMSEEQVRILLWKKYAAARLPKNEEPEKTIAHTLR